MSQYLLDTNICVFYLRGKFDVDQRMDLVGWENCFISEITMLELKMGAELSMRKDGIDRSKRLNEFLSERCYRFSSTRKSTIAFVWNPV